MAVACPARGHEATGPHPGGGRTREDRPSPWPSPGGRGDKKPNGRRPNSRPRPLITCGAFHAPYGLTPEPWPLTPLQMAGCALRYRPASAAYAAAEPGFRALAACRRDATANPQIMPHEGQAVPQLIRSAGSDHANWARSFTSQRRRKRRRCCTRCKSMSRISNSPCSARA